MPGEQLNLRMPGELAQRVRVRAAELGVRPRDVAVEALEAYFTPAGQHPEIRGLLERALGLLGAPAPIAVEPIPGQTTIPLQEPQSRGCPECGGDLAERPNGVLVCGDCDYAVSP